MITYYCIAHDALDFTIFLILHNTFYKCKLQSGGAMETDQHRKGPKSDFGPFPCECHQ